MPGLLNIAARCTSAIAIPTPLAKPCPNGPVVVSIPSVIKIDGGKVELEWQTAFEEYQKENSELAEELTRRFSGELPAHWKDNLTDFKTDEKGMASRKSSGAVLNTIADSIPELVGGSVDH